MGNGHRRCLDRRVGQIVAMDENCVLHTVAGLDRDAVLSLECFLGLDSQCGRPLCTTPSRDARRASTSVLGQGFQPSQCTAETPGQTQKTSKSTWTQITKTTTPSRRGSGRDSTNRSSRHQQQRTARCGSVRGELVKVLGVTASSCFAESTSSAALPGTPIPHAPRNATSRAHSGTEVQARHSCV